MIGHCAVYIEIKNKQRERFNSPESCIKVLTRAPKAWFVNQTWNTIFDNMSEYTDTWVLPLNAVRHKIE